MEDKRSQFKISLVNEEDSASEGSCVEEENEHEYSLHSQPTIDLFSPTKLPSPRETLEWMKENYGFDLEKIVQDNKWDMYAVIKVVNFIRKYVQKARGESSFQINQCIEQVSSSLHSKAWDNDAFLIPVESFSPDPLLTYFDVGDSDSDWESDDGAVGQDGASLNVGGSARPSSTTVLEERVKQLEHELETIGERLLDQNISEVPAQSHKVFECEANPDQYYFDSYSHLDIHEEMLKDQVRTLAYRDAIEKNPKAISGKVVLDVGCGTGILSLFAARAGAKRVFGIDNSQMAMGARQIIKDNGYEDTITVIQDRVENVEELPGFEKEDRPVDIIVSEWMGYALLYESMLDSVLHIRDRLLKQGGRVFPNLAQIFVEGLTCPNRQETKKAFWKDVYGFDMTCLISPAQGSPALTASVLDEDMHVPDVLVLSPEAVCTDRAMLHEIDIETVKAHELDFSAPFQLVASQSCTLSALAISFDCLFTGRSEDDESWSQDISLPTGIQDTPTHWQQTRLWLRKSLELKQGDVLRGTLSFSRNTDNPREIDMKLHLESEVMEKTTGSKYVLDQVYHMK